MDESWLVAIFRQTPFLASFLAGILTFLSPCILPLLPAYFSYISGLSIDELKQNNPKHLKIIIRSCLLFVLGFFLVFIILGFFLNTMLGTLFNHIWMRYVAGAIVCVFGFHFMGLFKINAFYKTKRIELKHSTSIFSPFLLGVSFSLGWSPCVGPILASIFTLSMTQKHYSLLLITIYCFGLAIPFLLTSLFVGVGLKFFKSLSSHLRKIEILSGILLVMIGLAIMFDGVSLVTTWIQNL